MKTINIERVNEGNISNLLDLIKEFTCEFVSEENSSHVRNEYSKYLKSNDNLVSLILFIDGKPSGCIQLFYYKHPPMLDDDEYIEGEMLNFYVIKKERNIGYGQKLLDAFLNEAKEKNVRFIRLNSSPDAERIYERNGFKKPPFNVMGKWIKYE